MSTARTRDVSSRVCALVTLLVTGSLSAQEPAKGDGAGAAPRNDSVLVVQVLGEITAGSCESLREKIEEQLERSGYRNLILSIDTPGGELAAAQDFSEFIFGLRKRRVFTVAWVPTNAIAYSAGTMIAFACEAFEMGESAKIGAVAPVTVDILGRTQEQGEKIQSVVRADLLSYAKEHGFPDVLVKKMVTKEIEAWRVREQTPTGNTITRYIAAEDLDPSKDYLLKEKIAPRGELLVLDEKSAKEHGFIDRVLPTIVLVREKHQLYGDSIDLHELDRNPAILTSDSSFVRFLNHFVTRFALILIGALFLVIEMKVPGSVLPGLTGLVAFFLYFLGGYLSGSAGWLEISLFLGALGLLGVEIFFLPGFGVAGVSGLIILIASLVLAIHAPGEPLTFRSLSTELLVVLSGLLTAMLAVLALLQWMPGRRAAGRSGLVLSTVLTEGAPVAASEAPGAPGPQQLLHRQGRTLTPLRPSGKVEIDGLVVDVVAAGDFVDAGTSVQVIEVEGQRVVVARAAPAAS